jgi:hypothetical protein
MKSLSSNKPYHLNNRLQLQTIVLNYLLELSNGFLHPKVGSDRRDRRRGVVDG